MRIRHTVGADEAVVAEILVAWVVVVVVAAIHINGLAVLADSVHALVDEVPDESALELWILADKFPIFAESAL